MFATRLWNIGKNVTQHSKRMTTIFFLKKIRENSKLPRVAQSRNFLRGKHWQFMWYSPMLMPKTSEWLPFILRLSATTPIYSIFFLLFFAFSIFSRKYRNKFCNTPIYHSSIRQSAKQLIIHSKIRSFCHLTWRAFGLSFTFSVFSGNTKIFEIPPPTILSLDHPPLCLFFNYPPLWFPPPLRTYGGKSKDGVLPSGVLIFVKTLEFLLMNWQEGSGRLNKRSKSKILNWQFWSILNIVT